jgi:hypothetical protein
MLPTVTKATLVKAEGSALDFTFQFNPSSLELQRSVSWNPDNTSKNSKSSKTAKSKGSDAADIDEEADVDSAGGNLGEMGAPWPRLGGASGKLDSLSFSTLFDQSEDHDDAELSASSLLSSFASLMPGLPAAMSLLPGNTKDVVDQIEQLYKLTLHQKMAENVIRPPMLTFKWGSKFIFTGVLTSVKFKILQFDASGRATRAEVDCEMEGRFGSGRTKIFETLVIT